MSDIRRDAEAAPAPDGTATVRRYTPYEVVRVDLRADGLPYRGVARASYVTPSGRLAYDLLLWPSPRTSPSGWYWFDASRMRAGTTAARRPAVASSSDTAAASGPPP